MKTPAKGAGYEELIANREFIVVDLETTTQDSDTGPTQTLPVSIGCVLLRNGRTRETRHWLLNPGVPTDTASSAYNGLTDDDLVGQPDEAAVIAQFDAFLAAHPDAELVCHNAHFDIVRLHEAYDRTGRTRFTRTVLDTQFIGARLKVGGVPARISLHDLAARYGVDTTVDAPKPRRRLYKGLKDAQDTAEVLGWLFAEAAKRGITDYGSFVRAVKPKSSDDMKATPMRRRLRAVAPVIPDDHVAACHRLPLPAHPSADDINAWTAQLAQCVDLRCPYASEKVTIETAHAALLVPAVTTLLSGVSGPGQIGTLLGALEPLLAGLDRAEARAWYKAHHPAIRNAAACTPAESCPACVEGHPCPQDVIYQLLTRRALDYGGISWFSKQVKKDLYYGASARKIDTWPRLGMADMAAHMMWLIITEAHRQRMTTKARTLLRDAMTRDLHFADPRLALEAARYHATLRDDAAVTAIVTETLSHATTDPGYLELEIWHLGPYKRELAARTAAANRAIRPPAKGLRKPAPIELRPPGASHNHRYQLHRRTQTMAHTPDASAPNQLVCSPGSLTTLGQ
jgi:DNA polymerase III epsilon subunit-like protein